MAFREVVTFYAIPLGILIFSFLVQRQFKARLNAGLELFAFLLSLDLTFLVYANPGSVRINPEFKDIYGALFVALAVVSLIFLAIAARVQEKIYNHTRHALNEYYPLGGVFACWLFALCEMGFHLYVSLGGKQP